MVDWQCPTMSTSKLDTSGVFHSLKVHSQATQLSLAAHSIRFRKNGIEFRTANAIPIWTEMTVDLQSAGEAKKLHCTGVVVDCTGNRHTGYLVSMVFMNLTRQSQEHLSRLAYSQLA
jgi:hypothetical protein